MLKTYVTHDRVVDYEPRIADYLATGQSDYTDVIASALEVLTQDLKSNKLELKKLCVPLALQASTSETTSATGAKSGEDIAERRIWIVATTAVGATEVFTLQGTNDTASETWTTITTLAFTSVEEQNVLFDDVYKFYRVNYAGTSATYSSELREESFYLAHVYLSLSMIYEQLRARVDSFWEDKSVYYMDRYRTQLKNIIYTYDANLSGGITTGEQVNFVRATFHR